MGWSSSLESIKYSLLGCSLKKSEILSLWGLTRQHRRWLGELKFLPVSHQALWEQGTTQVLRSQMPWSVKERSRFLEGSLWERNNVHVTTSCVLNWPLSLYASGYAQFYTVQIIKWIQTASQGYEAALR